MSVIFIVSMLFFMCCIHILCFCQNYFIQLLHLQIVSVLYSSIVFASTPSSNHEAPTSLTLLIYAPLP
jgi:hypothetical protein